MKSGLRWLIRLLGLHGIRHKVREQLLEQWMHENGLGA